MISLRSCLLYTSGVGEEYVPQDSHNWAETPEQAQETGRVYYRDKLEQVRNSGGIALYALSLIHI